MTIFKNIKRFLNWMNDKGIPVPIARVEGKPSVSFTLLIMSAAFVMLGLIDPVVKLGINVWEALAWHVTSAVLYYNRSAKITRDGVEINSSNDEHESENSESSEEDSGESEECEEEVEEPVKPKRRQRK